MIAYNVEPVLITWPSVFELAWLYSHLYVGLPSRQLCQICALSVELLVVLVCCAFGLYGWFGRLASWRLAVELVGGGGGNSNADGFAAACYM